MMTLKVVDLRTVLTGLITVIVLLAGCATERSATSTSSSIALARQEMQRSKFTTALDLLEEARFSAESPHDKAEVALLTGDCHLELKRFDQAVLAYFRARTANKGQNSTTTYLVAMGLGRSYEAQNLWPSAERHYLEAVSFSGDPSLQDKALLRLGVGSLDRGRLDRAGAYRNKFHDKSTFGFPEFSKRLDQALERRGSMATAPARVVMPSVLAPEIHRRRIWRAEQIRYSGKPTTMKKPWRITVHHAASPDIPPTAMGAAAKQMREYQKFHQETRGWADIGYHYVIDGAGRVWEGREMAWQGAHAGNDKLNAGNIGVCLMGNFVKRDPTPSQKRALKQLLSWLCESNGIHPHFVAGHRQVLKDVPGKSTLCPGARLEAYLNRLKPFLPRP